MNSAVVSACIGTFHGLIVTSMDCALPIFTSSVQRVSGFSPYTTPHAIDIIKKFPAPPIVPRFSQMDEFSSFPNNMHFLFGARSLAACMQCACHMRTAGRYVSSRYPQSCPWERGNVGTQDAGNVEGTEKGGKGMERIIYLQV